MLLAWEMFTPSTSVFCCKQSRLIMPVACESLRSRGSPGHVETFRSTIPRETAGLCDFISTPSIRKLRETCASIWELWRQLVSSEVRCQALVIEDLTRKARPRTQIELYFRMWCNLLQKIENSFHDYKKLHVEILKIEENESQESRPQVGSPGVNRVSWFSVGWRQPQARKLEPTVEGCCRLSE